MNPFCYPKTKLVRSQTPPAYAAYKRYKPFLQVEFGRQCVYCRMPDVTRESWFGADHYKPKSLFPDLSAEYSNLYYCCNQCNARKGDYWEPHSRSNRYVPNPCDHVMWSHLRFRGGIVEARTETGRFAEELLDLNDPSVVQQREGTIHLIDLCLNSIREAERMVVEIQKLFNEGVIPQAVRDAETANASALIKKSQASLGQLIPT